MKPRRKRFITGPTDFSQGSGPAERSLILQATLLLSSATLRERSRQPAPRCWMAK